MVEWLKNSDRETMETALIISSCPQRTSSNRESSIFHIYTRILYDGQYTSSRNIVQDVDKGMNPIDILDLVPPYLQTYWNKAYEKVIPQSTKNLWLPQLQRKLHISCTDLKKNITLIQLRSGLQHNASIFCVAGLNHGEVHISIWVKVRTWERSYYEYKQGE